MLKIIIKALYKSEREIVDKRVIKTITNIVVDQFLMLDQSLNIV